MLSMFFSSFFPEFSFSSKKHLQKSFFASARWRGRLHERLCRLHPDAGPLRRAARPRGGAGAAAKDAGGDKAEATGAQGGVGSCGLEVKQWQLSFG